MNCTSGMSKISMIIDGAFYLRSKFIQKPIDYVYTGPA